MKPDAIFIGWQPVVKGPALALYNVVKKGHRLYLSTVTEKTLQAEGLAIPYTPPNKKSLRDRWTLKEEAL